ncbi:Zinc transporter ZupT [Geodia barretti]|uniref:Zinc transporter ZupT n=1 Tax=Geodia barretti TaxID=519541 RepID=A0AA35X127_GEOBA|nr:Zinc transporter ZupT [Geodia barretti]
MVNYTQFLNCTVGNASLEYSHCLADVPAYENCPDPSICEEQSSDEHLGLAFGLTIGAGLATTLGALLPFVPFIKQRNTRFLAAAMALAAGVMLYVSFTDIRTKSLNSFCCVSPAHFDALATSCFFGGILLTALLDILVWSLQKLDCGCGTGRLIVKRVKFSTARETLDVGEGETQQHRQGGGGEERISIEEGCRRRGTTRGKVRLQAVNGIEFDTDSLDASALILPPHDNRNGSAESSSSNSTTPTAQSLEEGCDAALEAEGAEMKEVAVLEAVMETEVKTIAPAEDENSSVQHSQTLTASDGVSISLVSNAMSENTNNIIATASVNELFSNSSLLRMNAVIPESASVCTAAVGVVGENGVKVVGDSASRVCVEVRRFNGVKN